MSKVKELQKAIEKELEKKNQFVSKREELNVKIQSTNKRIAALEKEVQTIEMDTLMQLIKEKGISPSEAVTAIEAGYLDELIRKEPEHKLEAIETHQGEGHYVG